MNKDEVLDFIKKEKFIFLSTINFYNYPETRALINITNSDIAPHLVTFFEETKKIYMMTNTSSAKISHIRTNNMGSLYIADFNKYKGLSVMGKVLEVKDEKTKENMWHNSWKMYYKGGLYGGDFSILEFVPERYKFYENLSVIEGKIDW